MASFRQLAAIMFTDIQGYTAIMQHSEARAIEIRNKHRAVFNATTESCNGRIIQYYGDGTLSIFNSAVEALNCSIALQKQFLSEPQIPVRIGIHIGDIIISDEDIIGDGVNIASRIESLGVPGSVLFSRKVLDEVRNQNAFQARFLGSYHFKNVNEPMEIYALANTGLIIPQPSEVKGKLEPSEIGKPIPGIFRSYFGQIRSDVRSRMLFIFFFLLLFSVSGIWLIQKVRNDNKAKMVRQEILPRIGQMSEDLFFAGTQTGEGRNAWLAFLLAKEAEETIHDDPALEILWPRFSKYIRVYTDPPGASVYAKAYEEQDSAWWYFGTTPLDSVLFPTGYSKIKLEKEGFQPVEDIIWHTDLLSNTYEYRLSKTGRVPEGMVQVGRPQMDDRGILKADFFMDKFEVTNQDYQRFIDAGGYQNKAYWENDFWEGRKPVLWEEAIARFIDKTGNPGPSTWISGTYPEGEALFPVGGISWYEAAAYAKWAGKELPTYTHWNYAAGQMLRSVIIPASNFQSNGPLPSDRSISQSRFGVINMIGNMREWVYNGNPATDSCMSMGSAWNDLYDIYGFDILTPWDRNPTNGFRCCRYLGEPDNLAALKKFNPPVFNREVLHTKPVSPEVFNLYAAQFNYDQSELEALVENTIKQDYWTRQTITFNTAYGKERMTAFLFLPRESRGSPPYQTVVYWPAANAFSESVLQMRQIDFLMKSGRAVMYPVYKGTHIRRIKEDAFGYKREERKHYEKEMRIMQIKDLKRSIEYLLTRDDIDTAKLAYMGISWGGVMGPIALAVEEHLKCGVLIIAGLTADEKLPEVDELYYLPYVTKPVLMMNGEYDWYFPFQSSQKPFFDLLGTPKDRKSIKISKGGHHISKLDLVRESTAWLDRYLGPVKKKQPLRN